MAEKTDLADILQKQNLISSEQASQVKLEQINTGRDLLELIKERGWVTAKQIVAAQAELLKVPFVDLAKRSIPTEILVKIPESVARHYILVPFELQNDTLSVAMKDPLDLQLLEFLETKTACKIKAFIAEEEEIVKTIRENYEVGMEKEVRAALKETEKEAERVEAEVKKLESMEEIVKYAPVARIVSTILDYAAKSRASDVHIEPQEGQTRVRYRVDGVLQERLSLPRAVHDAVVSRIKILANLKIDEKRIPQDGRFMIESAGTQIDLRVSTLPASHGEKVVMRLLRKSGEIPSLSELGLRANALKHIEQALKKTHGIILVTGPTGSGKTTTLRTALSKVNSIAVNIVTLEDPVEYEIPGINQVQINPTAGLTFASGLRSILRQDPDVIMVGEIRDRETMELAIQAALTGHLVFSTLHTNSAAGTLPRLLDMGAEPFLLASTMEVVLAQRLVRTLCECKKEVAADEQVAQKFKEVLGPLFPKQKQLKVFQAVGCEKCGNAGFVGRMGIYEVLPVSEKIGRLILERETSDRIETQAKDEGMIAMLQDGFLKAIEGVTTVEEVLRVAQE
ncbi:MAG: type II/IV secretion system protein [Candidatus Cloacimonetes bacterium]|nr:type II/IV secretion system protein [Candidatus Cloacimonadota bacterium]